MPAGSRTVTIGEHTVELRMTLLTYKRLREATGLTGRQLQEELQEAFVGAGEGADEEARSHSVDVMERRFTTYLWAMVAHHPELGEMTEDGVAGLIDMEDMEAVGLALGATLAGRGGKSPPPAARRKRATPPRTRK